MDDIQKKIANLYQKAGYMDKYGSDVWSSAIVCIIFIVLTVYFYYMNILQVVKSNWETERCNPLLIPFAGIINKPNNMSGLEYTAENFTDCVNSFLKYVAEVALAPLQYIIVVIQKSCEELIESINVLRDYAKEIRKNFSDIISKIYRAIANFTLYFVEFSIKVKDSIAKISGILTTSLFTLFGSYMAMQSLFLIIIDMLILILVIVAVICLTYLILSFLPFIGGAFKVQWFATVLIMIAIIVPTAMIQTSMMRIMNLTTPRLPGIPGCFSKNTRVELYEEGVSRKIKNLNLGDKLKNGSIVTAIIQFDASEQHIYNLNNVIVTGEHRVFHPEKKWIKAKDHPESVAIPFFNEPYVYCINTDKKEFTIGATRFSDWDDIDEKVLADLEENCVKPGYLPANFSLTDIHLHLDSGLRGDTLVTLKSGKKVPIVDLEVGSLLNDIGGQVVGLVVIDANQLDVYKYSLPNCDGTQIHIYGTQNIHLTDPILGVLSGFTLTKEKCKKERYLYHLLTTTKFFVANGIWVNDYNSGIDQYLTL